MAVHVSYGEGGEAAECVVPGHLGHQGDAEACVDEFVDGAGIVAFHDHLRREACFLAEGFQYVPEDEALRRSDVVLVRKVCQVDVGEPGVAIGEGKHHHQIFPEKGDRMVVVDMMDTGIEGEVRMLCGGLYFWIDDFQHGFGMGFPELRQEGGDELGGGKDGQVYRHLLKISGIPELLLHFFVLMKEILCMFQKDMAVSGEMDISAFPFEKGDAQFLLLAPNGAGQGGLGDMEGFRGFGEMFHLRCFPEIFQGSEI